MMATQSPLPRIQSLSVLGASRLRLVFDNNETRIADISQFMDKGVFQRLRDESVFRAVRSYGYFVQWPQDIDLSADTLYLCSEAEHANA
jgi:Protein of unknown function (DUF2442)